MMLGTLLRAVLAAAVCVVLTLASTAHAGDVPAASFLAGCPGPIFVLDDTTLVGVATVKGNCTLSTATGAIPGRQINLRGARLSFTGFFKVLGDASSMTVDASRITAGTDLVLDSHGLMTISGSTLTAQGGSIRLPPRDSLAITRARIVASGSVTVGGNGGLYTITDSDISAGGAITIAPGSMSISSVPTEIDVAGSTLSAQSSITVGGSTTTQTIAESTLEALGTGTAIRVAGISSGARLISASTMSAPHGSISLDGSGMLLVENAKVSSGAGPGVDASIRVGNSGGAFFRHTQFKSPQGTMSFTGAGNHVFVDCKMVAGGVEASGQGVRFSAGGSKSFIETTIQANAGDIRAVGAGEMAIMGSSLAAKGEDGITISSASSRTIVDSKLDAPRGPITITGNGNTEIVASTLFAKNAGGMLLSCLGSSAINASKLDTLGAIRIPNGGGSSVAASKLDADAGFITETGLSGSGDSNLLVNQVKASSVVVRSFQETTVTDNKLKATDFEFSSTGTCTSTRNNPDIPCF